jgi:hypothetical protein
MNAMTRTSAGAIELPKQPFSEQYKREPWPANPTSCTPAVVTMNAAMTGDGNMIRHDTSPTIESEKCPTKQ